MRKQAKNVSFSTISRNPKSRVILGMLVTSLNSMRIIGNLRTWQCIFFSIIELRITSRLSMRYWWASSKRTRRGGSKNDSNSWSLWVLTPKKLYKQIFKFSTPVKWQLSGTRSLQSKSKSNSKGRLLNLYTISLIILWACLKICKRRRECHSFTGTEFLMMS